MDGIIVVNKEKNCTSRDVVNEVGHILNTKKIGHTGTLDPIAEGVLVLTLGNHTKLVELLTSKDKEYIAEIVLGIKTDTLDITGNILKEEDTNISKEEILKTLKDFPSTYLQQVPIYSAVKIKGKKLYEYARENIEVELPKREVQIKELQLLDYYQENNKTIFKIKCLVSKGTYIRSLINDIAENLKTYGTMRSLIRTKQGKFNIKDAVSIEDIKNNNFKLYQKEEIIDEYKKVECSNELYSKIKNGQLLENVYNEDVITFIYNKKIIAIYKKYKKQDNLLKPWKMFI